MQRPEAQALSQALRECAPCGGLLPAALAALGRELQGNAPEARRLLHLLFSAVCEEGHADASARATCALRLTTLAQAVQWDPQARFVRTSRSM